MHYKQLNLHGSLTHAYESHFIYKAVKFVLYIIDTNSQFEI